MGDTPENNTRQPRDGAPGTAPSTAEILNLLPQRSSPEAGAATFKQLGNSPFAARYGSPDRQATGHWCTPCQGIWFGYLLEVTCPVCGNRRG